MFMISIGSIVMTENEKPRKNTKFTKNITQMRSFLQNYKNPKRELFVFCLITFEPIEVQTLSAPQIDRLNFSFVKDIFRYVIGKQLATNGLKRTFIRCKF